MITKRIIILLTIFIWLMMFTAGIPFFVKSKTMCKCFKHQTIILLYYLLHRDFDASIFYKGSNLETIPGKVNIIVLNHISTVDWIIFYSFMAKKYSINNVHQILKDDLLWYPCIGEICSSNNDIFVKRDWKSDESTIDKLLQKIDSGFIMIFPEGTRFTKNKLESSKLYAKENNFVDLDNLLLPKSKGTWKIINSLMKDNKLGNFYDITCISTRYRRTEMYMKEIFCDGIGDVYLDIKKVIYPDKSILIDKSEFKLWLHSIWKQKDILMDNFTKDGYNKLDSPYETDLIFHVVLSLIILLIVKKFGWKYLLANFGLTYIKLICTKLFS